MSELPHCKHWCYWHGLRTSRGRAILDRVLETEEGEKEEANYQLIITRQAIRPNRMAQSGKRIETAITGVQGWLAVRRSLDQGIDIELHRILLPS